ncbi:EF-P beta-lysylation protein EpmB [Calycomorphotria hydatis]|uniref:L-lysine 2,3-aminomutase n=1 Tax=Calycomorphotria hydatis TaxID=2528027 RepID=A0A517T7Z2_9PLAN|nr:EF-P beta-lysylation protein EpmB [Calycomorphotria hydatis]QDT64487.1 L-lysine 2,3-aminomutase [Calycomorphotria hydatis]
MDGSGNVNRGSGHSCTATEKPAYFRSLAEAIRDSDELLAALGLPTDFFQPATEAAKQFPLLVPRSYVRRMQPGDVNDPLLRQVLPLADEMTSPPTWELDPVGDGDATRSAGLIQKYQGRALLIATGSCAVHCRYCFRRHFPYEESPRRLEDWQPAFDEIAADSSLHEIIFSGGDPLMLTDTRLAQLVETLDRIPHLTRLRIHTRLPIVLPDRVTDELLQLLSSTRMKTVLVVHANHANELVADCAEALQTLVSAGITMLNQAVLLRGVNDSADALCDLSERLIDLGVLPYYLHQLDRVIGAEHFEVPIEEGRELIAEMRSRLPGYLVPRYVQEIAGAEAKTPLM